MIAHLKPYPKMKDSGVPWLGEVPEHWEVVPPKRLLRSHSAGSAPVKNSASAVPKDGYVPAFSASGQDVWLPTPMFHGSALVLSAVGARCGKTFRADGAWGVVANTHVLFVTGGNSRDFWWYVTNNEDWWERAGAAQPFVQVSKTLNRVWAIPTLPEQAAIVRFLDHVDRRIRRYIRAKQKLIKLLEELKAALIHRAVTGQIDVRTGKPYPAYKPSGVEWLGEVPEHWDISKVKHLARPGYKTFIDGDWIESPFITNDGIRLIQTGNIGVGVYREKGFRYISASTFEALGCTEVKPNDVLICRLGEPVGRACLAPNLGVRMITSVDVCILMPRTDVLPRFLVYAMTSPQYLDWVNSLVRGSTLDRVSRKMLGNFFLPSPPPPEQAAIVRYLEGKTAKIDKAIEATRREIALLREFRTRLIADVVTGKLDVREAAARLPDEAEAAEDFEPLDDAEAEAEEAGAGEGEEVPEEAEA